MFDRSMVRYYAIATLLVVALGSFVFARRLSELHDFDVHATPRPGQTPTQTRAAAGTAAPNRTFVGEGSWVLSALPDCFVQLSSIVGPSLQLTHHIPPERERIRPATTLHRGDCTIAVGEHDVWISRDGDRLRVPPDARLYDDPQGLTLVYRHADRTEVRIYGGIRSRP